MFRTVFYPARVAMTAGALLLALTAGARPARAGACAGPRHDTYLEVQGGPVLPPGRAVQVAFGLAHHARGGWPDCRALVRRLPAPAVLEGSRRRTGPFAVVARGTGQSARWTPSGAGLWWLRATTRDPQGKRHTARQAVLVAAGEVRLPAWRPAAYRAVLWAPGGQTGIVREGPRRRRGGWGALRTLPRAEGWWLLTAPGKQAWVRVSATGEVQVTAAPSQLRLQLDDVLQGGWIVAARHPGAPPLEVRCAGDCRLGPLPSGRVTLEVTPSPGRGRGGAGSGEPQGRIIAVTLGRRGPSVALVSAMHLLAGRPQPGPQGTPVWSLPRLRGPVPPAACSDARPFDGPAGTLGLGRALCRPPSPGRGGAWRPWVGVPAAWKRGEATPPVVRGRDVVWAETKPSGPRRTGTVRLLVASAAGVAMEQVPVPSYARAAAVAVGPSGDLWVAGHAGLRPTGRGFLAVRRAHRWEAYERPTPVTAVLPRARGALALDGRGVVTCGRRCTNGPAAPEPLVALVSTPKGVLALARTGARYALRGGRLKPLGGKPSHDYPLGQVVQADSATHGLFGPVTAGSEYHPYCVASVVARLTPQGWTTVHRVGGARGRRLDCQDDDRRPPVVTDLAVAGGALFVRRRARQKGLLPGWHRLPPRRP